MPLLSLMIFVDKLKEKKVLFLDDWKGLTVARKVVQCTFTLYSIYIGYKFYHFYLWATGQSQIYVPRPPSVEAFLPISALVGLKQFIFTGIYDFVHPAGLTILLAALAISLLFRRGFCGWICPIGLLSEILDWVGRKIGLGFKFIGLYVYPLYSIKYLLLGFFIYMIFWKMDIGQTMAFLKSPYNLVVDGKMLLFFLEPGRISLLVLTGLIVLSLIVRNFWCRFACPYGALLGIIAFLSPLYMRRDDKKCAHCKRCSEVCPGGIDVSSRSSVRVAECIGCMECAGVCPEKECLEPVIAGRISLNPYIVGLGVVLLFLGAWLAAFLTGHWDNHVPAYMWRRFYMLFMGR